MDESKTIKVFNRDATEILVWLRRTLSHIRKIIPTKFRHKFPSVGRYVPHSSRFPKSDNYALVRDNTRFLINRSDYVQWRIFYGVRDNALLAAKKSLTHNSLVLDIGASVGAFSLKLAKYALKNGLTNVSIHAFEPNPSVFELLSQNLSLNPDLKSIVQLHNYGLGNETAVRTFQFSNENSGAGRVLPDGDLKIQVKKLDDVFIDAKFEKIAFIKLIVEGFEPEVIKGGWQTIQKLKPPIFLEITPSWWQENNSTVHDVLNPLKELGYTFLIERYNELMPLVSDKDLSGFQFNVLAIPE